MIKTLLKATAAVVFTTFASFSFFVVALDTLEYETTGECQQCHILPVVRSL